MAIDRNAVQVGEFSMLEISPDDGHPLYPEAVKHIAAAGGDLAKARATFAEAVRQWERLQRSRAKVPDAVISGRSAGDVAATRAEALAGPPCVEDRARALLAPAGQSDLIALRRAKHFLNHIEHPEEA
ncbi:hypothetical protein [Nocardioides mangrovi]|uniref:Uncharacterized protein n=1 Tax=Nocardioides mangrovi TaxID=2874580 RepID=A0ABS7U948_9ACTN|nr:hypothetical protein [Nocardioides mangrovi]MBZ5737509.1 hypothetical protein [Nocardioides mangrovi]